MSGWTELAEKKARKAHLEHMLLVSYEGKLGYTSFREMLKDYFDNDFMYYHSEAVELVNLYNEGI